MPGSFADLPIPPRFDALPLTGDGIFDRAIRTVFFHEGLWSNDPADPGGPTAWGVSLRFAQSLGDLDGDGHPDLDLDGDGDVDATDLKLLTAAQALAVYRKRWWDKFGYVRLGLPLAVKTFDLAVNMGETPAHKCLQRAVRACSGVALADDGVIGMKTITAVLDCELHPLQAAFRSEAAGVYRQIVIRTPKSERFLKGWLNRAYY